ncbi:MAG: thymidylate synthase [Candidatus Aminicenantes bacterium]|nr:thymidylate synthase [Candidatus Aminicenantes bacterium]
MQTGNIPVLFIQDQTIPSAYEQAIRQVWDNGARIRTEYDRPEDPPSRDASVVICVEEPFGQPRFHRSFADGLGGLAEYVMEVVHGAHDYWVKPVDEIMKAAESTDTRWTYTYHERLFRYVIEDRVVDQIDYLISKLAETGYSRRAQAITWNPKLDPPTDDPPCLQRVWGRLCEDGEGGLIFNMNTHWRSRDLFKAWFENVIAITTLMRSIANALAERTGKRVRVGRYVDMVDSMHIYGSYFREIEGDPKKGIKSFFEQLDSQSFADRTWDSAFVKPFFINDGIGKGLRPMLEREKNMPQDVRTAVQKELEAMEKDDYIV